VMQPYTDPTASMAPGASSPPVPMDPVPTSVAIGKDGAYYVGQLTGFPFPKGEASVFKVVPGQDPTKYATGLTNVMGVAFAPDDSLYVLEISENGLTSETGLPMGALLKVPAGGGTAEVVSSGLPMPGGIAVAADGTVYVSTCAVCPGGGSIASYKPGM
jgi:sugar lactone lactonase YvrE